MKKIHSQLLAALLLFSLLFVASCGKDEDESEKAKKENPTIVLDASTSTSTSTEQNPGADIQLSILASSGPEGRELKKFSMEYQQDGGTWTGVPGALKDDINQRAYTRILNEKIPTTAGVKSVSWRMTIEDKANKQASVTATYRIKSTTPIDTTKDTTKIVAPRAINSQTFSETARFMSTARGAIYDATNGQSNSSTVDIAYFFSTAAELNLVNPVRLNTKDFFGDNAITWGSVSTMFKTTNLTPAQFLAITDQKVLKKHYDDGTFTEVAGGNPSGTRATSKGAENKGGQIQNGKILAFFNGQKYGLIHISNANVAAKTLTVDVRVQN